VSHACGHQAWWENPELAEAVRGANCPWCGAETGQFAHYGILEMQGGRVFPAPTMIALGDEGEVLVIHRADETCCSGTVIEPFEGTLDPTPPLPDGAPNSDRVPNEFIALASDLRTIAAVLNDYLREADCDEPGSKASREVANEHEFGDDLIGDPVFQAILMGHRALIAATDHLFGIAACVEAEDVVFSTITLMRPAVIAAGLSFFVFDPDISTFERLRRAWNLELESLREQMNSVEHGSPFWRELESVRDRCIAWGKRHGFETHSSREPFGEPRKWFTSAEASDRPPSELRLADAVLEQVGGTGAGRNVYRFSSAFVHAQGHAFTLLMQAVGQSDPETPGVVPRGVALQDLMMWVAVVVSAVDVAAMRCGSYFGWSMEHWFETTGPILRRWSLAQAGS
jgi:hypothetical protein